MQERSPSPTAQAARRYHIWTIGCQMNEADSRRLAQQLEFAGFQPVDRPNRADVVILNTCVVRQQAENRAYGKLGQIGGFKRENPEMILGLMGCMVGLKETPALQKRFPQVDVFMPPSETRPLLDFLEQRGLLDELMRREAAERSVRDALQDEDLPLPQTAAGRAVTANVPVVLGCSHACTFCVIPYRRGAERSRPMAEILREVESLARQGVREVMLLGQIVDRYGTDFGDGTDLSRLLRETAKIDGIERIRFLTSHPNYMTDAILATVAAEPKVCPQIEVPIQAGNNAVLEAMRRGYTREQYRDLVARIRSFIPDAAIHTDIIVGFPGESEAAFEDTADILRELRLDKVHLAKYSVRPKTVAARRMEDDVPDEEKTRRWEVLEALQRDILAEKNQALRGTVVEVLVEGRVKGQWHGRTPQAKPVMIADDRDRDLVGQLVDVFVDWAGPFSLLGRPVASLQREREPEGEFAV